MAKVLFVSWASASGVDTDAQAVEELEKRQGHIVERRYVSTRQEAQKLLEEFESATYDAVVLANLETASNSQKPDVINPASFAEDVAVHGMPVITYDMDMASKLRVQLRKAGIARHIDRLDEYSLPKLAAAVMDALHARVGGRFQGQ